MVRLLMLSGLILLLAAPTASAGVREKILRECQEGRITGHYTPAQIRDARKNIPTDIDEYSDCRDVLARAALAVRGGGGAGGAGGAAGGGAGARGAGAGGSAPGGVTAGGDGAAGDILSPATPEEADALRKARRHAAAITVDGERLLPALAARAARQSLPATLIVVLVLLGLCAAAATIPSVRRHVIARRRADR
jgi:hypothetical protein